jgi:hypothetical protein
VIKVQDKSDNSVVNNSHTSMSLGSNPGISNYEAKSSTSLANFLISSDLSNPS